MLGVGKAGQGRIFFYSPLGVTYSSLANQGELPRPTGRFGTLASTPRLNCLQGKAEHSRDSATQPGHNVSTAQM